MAVTIYLTSALLQRISGTPQAYKLVARPRTRGRKAISRDYSLEPEGSQDKAILTPLCFSPFTLKRASIVSVAFLKPYGFPGFPRPSFMGVRTFLLEKTRRLPVLPLKLNYIINKNDYRRNFN